MAYLARKTKTRTRISRIRRIYADFLRKIREIPCNPCPKGFDCKRTLNSS